MWSCPCCLRFKFSPEEIEQRYKSQEIDRMIEKDKQLLKRQVKLLLLGAGESGKSTFLKQMRIIHGMKFDNELIKEFQHIIYQNVVKGMKVLVDARDKLGIPWEHVTNSDIGMHILKFENSMMLDAKLFMHYAPSLRNLWEDAGIKRAFERRREFQLVRFIILLNPMEYRIEWRCVCCLPFVFIAYLTYLFYPTLGQLGILSFVYFSILLYFVLFLLFVYFNISIVIVVIHVLICRLLKIILHKDT